MMGKVCRIMSGVLLGAAVGAAAVLLFTPQSGPETRQMIQDRVEAIIEEGRQAAEDRRLELTTRFEELKQPPPGV